jgi:hypothetical protein
MVGCCCARPCQSLQATLRDEHDDACTRRQRGIAWGRLSDLGQANLALAEEVLLAGVGRSVRAGHQQCGENEDRMGEEKR